MRNNNQTQGQKRGRNRNNNNRRGGGGGGNNRNTFDSNGPNVRIRGSASQIYDKYVALARDASSSGDRVLAENLLQHAEHYYRIANPAQDGQPSQRRFQQSDNDSDMRDDNDDNDDENSNNKNSASNGDDNSSSDGVVVIDTTPRETQSDADDSADENDSAGARAAESQGSLDDTPVPPKRGRGRPRKVKAAREPQTPAELAEAVAEQ
ncbi:MAG: DUF4167 domain-containing protein [Alphaproteobacteria bacterium]